MGLLNSIKKIKSVGKKLFPLKKKKSCSREEELNKEEESYDSWFHQETINDGESEDILDLGGSSSRENDEESEDILDLGGSSRASDEESEDILDGGLCDSSSENNVSLHGKKKEVISIVEEDDVLDLDEISHSSSEDEGEKRSRDLKEGGSSSKGRVQKCLRSSVEGEKRSRDLKEGGSSSKGRAQKCLRSSVEVKKEEITRNSKEKENNASLHGNKKETISIEDVLDLDEICRSSIENEGEKKSRDLNEGGSSSKAPAQKCLRSSVGVKKKEIARNSKEKKNNASLHGNKKETISIEEEDVLDLDEICHSSSLHEISKDEGERKSRELNECGSSSKGPAQKCLRSARNRKQEKNKALHVKKKEIISIEEEGKSKETDYEEEDVLDGGVCDSSSSHHEKISEDEEKNGNSKDIDGECRQMNEEETAAAGNKGLHQKKREVISTEEEDGKHEEIDEEEVEAKKEEKVREMISEIQERERAILEFDRALAYAKLKLKMMTEKPRKGKCMSEPSYVLRPQNTSIFQEEKPKKSKKRVTFVVEEEKVEGICISNEEEKIEIFADQSVEKPTKGECVSKEAGPRCVFGKQDTSVFQEEKPEKYEKREKFTVEEKGIAEGIHVSNEEERFDGQEEPKMRRTSNEEDGKLEGFVATEKGDHHNGVCNEEEKIKGGLDEIRPQEKSVSNKEENNNKVACDEGRKVQGFDERQAKKGPVCDCSFQWKELMELKGNFDDDDDDDVAKLIGGIMQGRNSCGYRYNNTWDNKPYEDENAHHNMEENVHHNKSMCKFLFSFGIGLSLLILRIYCIMVS